MGAALAQERDARVAPRPRAAPDPPHADLGRRPPRRAAGHVRRPAPARLQDLAPEGGRDRRGPRGLGVRREDLLPGRAQRGRRPVPGGLAHGADPLRGDAARLLRRRRPRAGHGHQRGLGVGELPEPDHRVLRLGVLALLRPRARARGHPGVERLVLRGVALALSRTGSSRWASRSSATPSSGAAEIRRNAARGFTAVTLPEQPHRIGMEPIFSDWWEPILAACAETGTVDLPARRVERRRGLPGRRAGEGAAGHAVRPARVDVVRGVALVEVLRAPPRAADRDERRRDRLGRDAARPAREPRRPLGLRPELRAGAHAGRRAAPQLLVLHDRRPVDALDAADRRRRSRDVRDRLPPRRRHLARQPAGVRRRLRRRSPPTGSPRSATRTRPASSATRSRPAPHAGLR